MLILYLARPKSGFQGFLAVLTVLAGWIMVLLARSSIPQVITLISWETIYISSVSPSLLIDEVSWYFALAIMSLTLALMITSIAQLGQSRKPNQPALAKNIEVNEEKELLEQEAEFSKPLVHEEGGVSTNWRSWAGILILTSLGLVAVTAGNMLTLLLAWAALDVIELVILLDHYADSRSREKVILAFSVRMAGIGAVLLAAVITWSQGLSLSYEAISQSTSIYLLLAAGLRLGVLPIHLPLSQEVQLRRGLGTALRLIPAASSYILLVRVANIGVLGAATGFLLVITALGGLFAARNWLIARDELNGRPFWLIGTASLVVTSAILNRPEACIAWSVAGILSGGQVFSMSIRHKNLIAIIFLGFLNFSAIPFTPTWLGTGIYQYSDPIKSILSPYFFFLLSIMFLLIEAILLAGLFRHTMREIFPALEQVPMHVERWVWFLYPLGLLIIIFSHIYIGLWLLPVLNEIPVSGWIMGVIATIIAGLIWYLSWRFPQVFSVSDQSNKTSAFNKIISLDWLYQLVGRLYRILARFFALISTILEGEAGILWALVLFALIFVFLQR
jgi:hypothetical protein